MHYCKIPTANSFEDHVGRKNGELQMHQVPNKWFELNTLFKCVYFKNKLTWG